MLFLLFHEIDIMVGSVFQGKQPGKSVKRCFKFIVGGNSDSQAGGGLSTQSIGGW